MTLEQAIARQEGFLTAGTRAQRNNNPGNLVFGSFALVHGAKGGDGGYAVFPNAQSGFAALRGLLTGPAYKGLTVEAAINKYCPPQNGHALTEGNEPDAYVKDVCTWCGCDPLTIIDSLL